MEDKVMPFPNAPFREVPAEPAATPFAQTDQYQKVLSAAHEHLLNRIEDERIDIDAWAPDTVSRWAQGETAAFVRSGASRSTSRKCRTSLPDWSRN